MSRPSDWQPFRSSDPVPGDPLAVKRASKHYLDVADAIDDAARNLRRLVAGGEGTVSKAVDELDSKAEDVADDISKAEKRYRETGEALQSYWPKLEAAQDKSLNALNTFRDSEEEGDGEDEDKPVFGETPEEKTARTAIEEAESDRDSAAKTAKEAIEKIHKSGGLKDGWWANWGSKVTKFIQKWASRLAAICGILALCVGWIPVIGQALAAVLGAAALVFTVISLVCNIALMIAGEGSWLNLGLDVLGLATFGLGRAFGAGLKAGKSATQGATRLNAGRQIGQGGTGTMRSLTGSRSIADLSRNSARGLVGDARALRATNPFRQVWNAQGGLIGETRAAASQLTGTNIRAGLSQMSGGLSSIRANGLSGLYGNADGIAHAATVGGIDDVVRGSAEVTEWTKYTSLANGGLLGSNVASNANDAYGLVAG